MPLSGGPQDKQTMPIGSLKPELKVWPNPFTTKLDIRYEISDMGYRTIDKHISHIPYLPSVRLKIYDAAGRLVKQFNHLSANQRGGNYQFNYVLWYGDDDLGRRLPAGVYFVRLDCPEGVLMQKVVKLK